MQAMDLDWCFRLVVAAICGGFIGYERSARLKNAGIRTHIIVALGAALAMLISKYGFYDLLQHPGIGLDPSRIAAQIISGISFIGAGTILVRGAGVNGLTTAAGVWATAAVGIVLHWNCGRPPNCGLAVLVPRQFSFKVFITTQTFSLPDFIEK